MGMTCAECSSCWYDTQDGVYRCSEYGNKTISGSSGPGNCGKQNYARSGDAKDDEDRRR